MIAKAELLRRALIGFYSLLACYCIAVVQLIFHHPCAPPLPLSSSDGCSSGELMNSSTAAFTLERLVFFFHLAAALVWMLSAGIAFIGFTKIQFVARWLAGAFAVCYLAFGIYQLAVLRVSSSNAVVAVLCILLAICTLVFGVSCSAAYEQELRRQRAVQPEPSFTAVVTRAEGIFHANGAVRSAW
jgi:hypothetical protein